MVRWTEWGDPENRNVLFCAHGLSRSGRDFDYLGRALSDTYRVICPDYPGRGRSDWLAAPQHYNNTQYLDDTLVILDSLDYQRLDWVGTSMGGLIGMDLVARADNPVSSMVINDVGPFIPAAALKEIGDYLGKHPRFANLDEAMEYYRTVYAGFGPLEDHHYHHYVEHGVVKAGSGDGFVLSYDPAIIDQFNSIPWQDVDLWSQWQKIQLPVLVVRGTKSQLLLTQTVEQMKHFHPGTESVEFDHCAHAPSLMVDDQIEVVSNWLKSQMHN